MTRKGIEYLVNKICLTQGEVSDERVEAFKEKIGELPYLENVVIRHYINKQDYAHVAKVLDVTEDYVKYQFRKAIRHLRTPDRYYAMMLGLEGRKKQLDNHEGFILIPYARSLLRQLIPYSGTDSCIWKNSRRLLKMCLNVSRTSRVSASMA